jgi:transposase
MCESIGPSVGGGPIRELGEFLKIARIAGDPGEFNWSPVYERQTFLGERLRRLSRRLGGIKAKCAVGRSILVIIWHLLADPAARFNDLGPGWHDEQAGRDRRIRSHLRQLKALGLDITINPAAA